MDKVSVKDILKEKGKKKIAVLTCYDFSFASLIDDTDLDIILVGDSLANVILGLKETRMLGIKEMINHTQAVARGVKRSLVVADMPYASYQKDPAKALYYTDKFISAGADAVKLEWFSKGRGIDCAKVVKKVVKKNIAVMGHIGLTPQTAHLLGGYKVQGRDKKSALNLIRQAKMLEEAGVFSIVLECIPQELAKIITKEVKVPTIGIGAGKFCDGQVLVLYDLLGLYSRMRPKFVKVYGDLGAQTKKAVKKFITEVRNSQFPALNQSFSIKPDVWRQLIDELKDL